MVVYFAGKMYFKFIKSFKVLNAVWYGLVWFGMVWYGLVWFGMVWSGLVWFGNWRMKNFPDIILPLDWPQKTTPKWHLKHWNPSIGSKVTFLTSLEAMEPQKSEKSCSEGHYTVKGMELDNLWGFSAEGSDLIGIPVLTP